MIWLALDPIVTSVQLNFRQLSSRTTGSSIPWYSHPVKTNMLMQCTVHTRSFIRVHCSGDSGSVRCSDKSKVILFSFFVCHTVMYYKLAIFAGSLAVILEFWSKFSSRFFRVIKVLAEAEQLFLKKAEQFMLFANYFMMWHFFFHFSSKYFYETNGCNYNVRTIAEYFALFGVEQVVGLAYFLFFPFISPSYSS